MGLEIFSILFLSFAGFFTCLGLKLSGKIQWAWWLVCSPIWGIFLVCVFIFAFIVWIEKQAKD